MSEAHSPHCPCVHTHPQHTLRINLAGDRAEEGGVPFNQTETGQSSEIRGQLFCHLFILGHLISPVVQCSQQSFLVLKVYDFKLFQLISVSLCRYMHPHS